MESKPACLIDENNMFTRIVMVHGADGRPENYRLESGELRPGEHPIFDYPTNPDKKTKPKWDEATKSWMPTATPVEIEAATRSEYESMGLPYPSEGDAPQA